MHKRVIVADKSHADKIEALRSLSYHNSKGFSVKDEAELQNYCRWSSKDERGILLLALNEREEAVACLRANVYFCQVGLGAGNILFENHPEAFINYPALDMTIAATHPDYYGSGFLSLLRYYMYRLHHHTVRTITGVVVNNSLSHNQLQKLGYFFLASGYQSEDLTTVENWMLASLPADRVITALSTLRAKYAGLIHEYPLIIN